MNRASVEGRNGSWCFTFKKNVPHGSGKRQVEVDVPVQQVLELADQFRACPSGPAHTVYHLSSMAGRPKTCPRPGETTPLFFCRPCYAAASQIDVVEDGMCPTCQQETLTTVSEASRETASELTLLLSSVDPQAAARMAEALLRADVASEGSEDYEDAAELLKTFLACYQAGKRAVSA